MARFKQDVILNKPDDFVYFIMNDFLQKQGFIMSDWKGEPAYRTGDGFMEAYKYLKWSYENGNFHLEAWMKGNFGREWGLTGFVGCLVKKPYRESLERLVEILQQPLPEGAAQSMAGNGQGAQAGQGNSDETKNPYGQPNPTVIPVQTVDNHKAATQGLVFGILSIVTALFSPIIGIILGCLAISRGRIGQGSSKAAQGKAGKICGIVGTCISFGNWILNILLMVAGTALSFM